MRLLRSRSATSQYTLAHRHARPARPKLALFEVLSTTQPKVCVLQLLRGLEQGRASSSVRRPNFGLRIWLRRQCLRSAGVAASAVALVAVAMAVVAGAVTADAAVAVAARTRRRSGCPAPSWAAWSRRCAAACSHHCGYVEMGVRRCQSAQLRRGGGERVQQCGAQPPRANI